VFPIVKAGYFKIGEVNGIVNMAHRVDIREANMYWSFESVI